MAFTTAGKTRVNSELLNNYFKYIALGMYENGTFTEISNYGYARVSASVLSSTNGVIKNTDIFYFPEADDGSTADSLEESSVERWEINAIAFYTSQTGGTCHYIGQLASTIKICQGQRPKFAANAIQITLTES